MPRLPKKTKETLPAPEHLWQPDFDYIFSVRKGVLYIAGEAQEAEVVMAFKSDASAMKHIELVRMLGNTIANEAAKFALEQIEVGDTSEVRSQKLAFAQALAMWNKHVWTNINLLAKL